MSRRLQWAVRSVPDLFFAVFCLVGFNVFVGSRIQFAGLLFVVLYLLFLFCLYGFTSVVSLIGEVFLV